MWTIALVAAALAADPANPAPTEKRKAHSEGNDHVMVVKRFGLGYYGLNQVSAGVGSDLTDAQTVTMPTIGMRYWIDRRMGIDAAVGFGFNSGTTKAESGATSTTTKGGSTGGFQVHLGLPLSPYSGKHYAFVISPEAKFGYAGGKIPGTGGGIFEEGGTPDINLSGARLDVGARAGAEIQFGFIGVPELAIEGTLGAYGAEGSDGARLGHPVARAHHDGAAHQQQRSEEESHCRHRGHPSANVERCGL